MSAAQDSTTYDRARRKRSIRKGRERGCWVYVPLDELRAAGFAGDEAPFYRTAGHARSANAGSIIVSLYREP